MLRKAAYVWKTDMCSSFLGNVLQAVAR